MRITKWIVGVVLVVALLVPGIGLARAMPTLQASLTQPAIEMLWVMRAMQRTMCCPPSTFF
jgi:hypothetical protein